MKLALILNSQPNERWELAKQIGVTHATTKVKETPECGKPWEFESLLLLKNSFEDAGFRLMVYEGGLSQERMDCIRLSGPNRDEEIRHFCELLMNMGAVGIPIVSWTWMVSVGGVSNWLRTSKTVRSRGGSLATGYNHEQMQRGPSLNTEGIREEDLWKNLEYFLKHVVPVAEKADVKMALHPVDPPVASIRGLPQIIRSIEAFDRAMELCPSPHHGICFCQGCFAEMGVDIPSAIRHFGNKIHYAHFRDIKGNAVNFVETWVDDGPTDMLAAIRAYQEIGFEGPIRPDHVPTMAGESNDRPGYETKGRLFAIGYMKGLIERK